MKEGHGRCFAAAARDGHQTGDGHRRQIVNRREDRAGVGGVDDFLAEATLERKLALIKEQQADGWLVAMTVDGPTIAGLGAGRRRRGYAHRHAGPRARGQMVDLDSNPTKLIEIVEVGKQLLITRGALTTSRSRTTSPSTSRSCRPCSSAPTPRSAGGSLPGTCPLNHELLERLKARSSRRSFRRARDPARDPAVAARGPGYRPMGEARLLGGNLLDLRGWAGRLRRSSA